MSSSESFKVGDWLVEPDRDRITCGSVHRGLRPKVMDLLVYLAHKHGQVVSGDELLDHLWPGRVVTGGSVYRCVGELREALASHGANQVYVETIPKKGYRLRAPVLELEKESEFEDGLRLPWLLGASAVLVLIASSLIIGNRYLFEPSGESPKRPSIAVMAFDNISEGGGNEYFSDGLAEELLNLLAQMPELRVISRSSSFSFKGKDIPIPDVAEQLNVDLIIEGSVRRNGDDVRIIAQLIDASTDTHIWSQSYDRSIDDAFRVQDEVALAIINALQDAWGLKTVSQPRSFASMNPVAHDAFLRGRYLVAQRSTKEIKQAVQEFEKAIAVDPEFALAYAELAIATLLLTRGQYGDLLGADTVAIAEPLIARATELEPDMPEAHLSASFLAIIEGGHPENCVPHLERAIQLSPSNALAYSWLGSTYKALGRHAENFAATEASLRLNPLSQPTLINHYINLLDRRRLDEAEDILEKIASIWPAVAVSLRSELNSAGGKWADTVFGGLDSLRIDPDHAKTRLVLSWEFAYILLEREALAITDHYSPYSMLLFGKHQEAIARAEQLYAQNPDDFWARLLLGQALAGAGDYARARPMLEEIWLESGGILHRWGLRITFAAALIAARRDADADSDITDVLDAINFNVDRQREARMTFTYALFSIDFDEGYADFMAGDRERGIGLIAKAATEGFFILPAEAYFDVLHEDSRFAEILERQVERQMREQARFLAVVCTDNPYAGVWEPENGTCESAGF
jgi:TolB-like protein/DNA-binding winged helix-turn-helix (wHTH) protein/Tfp pilus assembly protein PilF